MLDHTLGIESFMKNGVRPSLIPVIASFLENRRMRVKWHGKESSERPLPGSSPQGSSFGILEYLSQSNDSASNVPNQDKFKFMDDLSILEVVLLTNIGLASHNPKMNVPSHIPSHNQFIPSTFLKTQEYLNEINVWTESKKMELNQKKTKSLIFNFTKDKQLTTDLKLKGEKVEIVKETKLLGAIITSDLKWDRNTNHIVKNANKMMRMLHIASKFTRNKLHLEHIYKTFVRSRLEYAATLWHSSLTVANRNDIERIQKSAMKIIFKNDYNSYLRSLKILKMETLYERRERLGLNFAKKCLKNKRMSDMFPNNFNLSNISVRNKEKYHVNHANTERYKNSTIPYLQRKLNESNKIERKRLRALLQVNCVSYVDPITS